jgi:hypothetical protein
MAQDFSLDHSAATSFTISLNSLADGADVTSSSIDLGATSEVAFLLEIVLDGGASSTGNCEIYLQWSGDDSKFPTVKADESDPNDQFIDIIRMDTTTEVVWTDRMEVKGRYVKVRIWNQSGDSLAASGNTAKIYPIHGDIA